MLRKGKKEKEFLKKDGANFLSPLKGSVYLLGEIESPLPLWERSPEGRVRGILR